jgi:threonine dehydratase
MTGTSGLTARDVYREALAAQKRIRAYVRETPLEQDFFLSQQGNCRVFLKLENLQLTGSFKLRGAFNKLLTLGNREKEKGVITASTGNHGTALTYAAQQLGFHSTVVVPEKISPAKLETLRRCGAELLFHGLDTAETEAFARQRAEKLGKVFISPYNDPMIIAGQGTVGLEIMKQLKPIDAVLAPVGGGGLMSGIAGCMKSQNRQIRIIGCQPEHSPIMAESIKAGHIVRRESKPTLADGSAGGIEEGSITFPFCRDYVDDYILVSEKEIKEAILIVLDKANMLIEGAAALPVASFIKERKRFASKNVVLVISGKKIHLDTLKQILCDL